MSVPGTIYLLHFDPPYKHAKHYLGWTRDLAERLRHHQKGTGGRLVAVAVDAGSAVELVRTWEGDRHLERNLKNRHDATRLCPICNPGNHRAEFRQTAPHAPDVAPAQAA